MEQRKKQSNEQSFSAYNGGKGISNLLNFWYTLKSPRVVIPSLVSLLQTRAGPWCGGKELKVWSQTIWVQILALARWMAGDEQLFKFYALVASSIKCEKNHSFYLKEVENLKGFI